MAKLKKHTFVINYKIRCHFSENIIMQDSKLINTLKLVSAEDLKGIKNLVSSELLIKGSYRKECEDLFLFIINYYPLFDDASLDKSNVLHIIFKGSDSKVNRLEKTMTNLLHIVEYYIAHFVRSNSYDNVKINLELSTFYRENKMPQRSEPFLQKARNILQEETTRLNVEYYYWLDKLNAEKIATIRANGEKISIDQHSDLFASSFEFSILLTVENFAKTTLLKFQLDEDFFNDLSTIITKNERLSQNVLIRLNLLLLWLFKTIREEGFLAHLQAFEALFDSNFSIIHTDSVSFFSSAKRACLSARHNFFFNNESLNLLVNNYKKDLALGFLLTEGYIQASTAINIVNNALKLKQNEWVKDFLNQYEHCIGLQYENRKEILNYCWSQYYFAERIYDKAEALCNIYYENIIYLITTKRLQIKIRFQKKEYMILESEIEAFKVYLHRQLKHKKTISEDFFTLNNSFVDAVKQIYALTLNPNPDKKDRLFQKIQKGKYSDQDWLLEKLSETK